MRSRAFTTVCLAVLAWVAGGRWVAAQQLNQAWAVRYNNGAVLPTADSAAKILADGAGNTYVIGSSGGSSATNIVVVKYNNSGAAQWTNRYFGPVRGVNAAASATLDANTNLIVVGYSQGAGTGADIVALKYNAAGTPQWTNRYDGPMNGDDQARGVAVDGSGNVFVGGFSQGVGTSYDFAVIKYSSAGTPLWTNRYNGPAGSSDQLVALATDGTGAVIATGTATGVGSGLDYMTVKYSSAGALVWTNRYTSPGNRSDAPTAIFVDGSGRITVTGSSFLTNNGAGSADFLTVSINNSSGQGVWTNRFNGTANSTDTPYAVTMDAAGNVFVAGASQSSGTSYDMATVKYDVNGVAQWTNRYDSPVHGADQARAVIVDGSGDAYVAGYSENSFGGSDFTLLRITSSTGENVFVQTYDGPAGSSDDVGTSVATATTGNTFIYVTGNSEGVGSSSDIATIKYDIGGTPQWTVRYSDAANGPDEAVATATDSEGNIYVAGKSAGAGTGLDFAVIKHNASGVPVWTNRYNGPGNGDDVAVALAVNAAGQVFLTGVSEGNIVTLKYAINGAPLWTNFYDGPLASSLPTAMALDAAGNVFVTGGSLNASGDQDYLTLKISTTNGATVWTNRYNGPGAGYDEATALVLDAAGNVLVTGNSFNSSSGADFATIKINATTGNNLWVARYNGPVSDYDLATALALDAAGNVFVAGASFGANFNNDYAVLKYNSNGAPQWTNRYDGPATLDDEPRALAVDASGSVYVTGYSYGSDPLSLADPNGSVMDFATIKYSNAGVALWTNRFNGPATNKNDDAVAIVVGAMTNLFVAGSSVGLGTAEDYATVMYHTNGTVQSTNYYAGPGNGADIPTALALRGRYNVLVTGRSVGVTGDTDFATLLHYQTNAANAAPTAVSQAVSTIEDTPLSITLAGTDPNGDPLHYVIVSGPTNGTLATLAPNLVYVPNPGYYGTDTITFRTGDGLLNSTNATISITVSNVNSPPVLGPFVDLSFVGVTGPQVVPFTVAHPANESAQTITVTATSSNPGLIPTPLTVTYTSGNASGTLGFTPVANAIGSAVITVTAQDNGGTAFGGSDRTVETFVISSYRPLVNIPRDTFPVANAAVTAQLVTNGVLYLGGTFTELGTNTGRAATFYVTNGAPLPNFPVFERAVQSVIPDGAGGWYVGGDFQTVGGQSRARLAHLLPSGLLDTNFTSTADGTVSALFLSGTNLFVGGNFTAIITVSGAGTAVATNSRVRFAVLDKDTGAPRDLGSNPQFDRQVLAIQPFTNNTVFVGGIFSNITNVVIGPVTNVAQRISLAAISLTNGQPTAFLADCRQATNGGTAFTNAVRALALLGTNLYVGGSFSYITNSFQYISNTIVPPTNGVDGTEQRTCMARLDALSGTVITNFRADMNNLVRTIVASGSNVYVGGDFTGLFPRLPPTGQQTNRNRLAALNFTNGVLRPWDPSVNGIVRSMVLSGTNIFVGGDFTTVNTNLVNRRRFAAFGTNVNLAATNITVAPINPNIGAAVNAVAAANGVAFAGGDFTFYGGVLRSRAAAVDLSTFEILPWNPDPDGTVLALTMVQTNIVLGGTFNNTRFGLSRRLAVVDTNGGAFRPGFTNGNFDNTVNTLVSSGNRLYVGGLFTIITNKTGGFENNIFRLAALDFDLDGAIAPGFSAEVLGTSVNALAIMNDTLYVGGDYTNIAGVARTRLAAVDVNSGSVRTGFVANMNAAVSSLLPSGTNLYVGGSFTGGTSTNSASFSCNRIMRINPANGGFHSSWNPAVSINNAVSTIAAIGTNIYIGGTFTVSGGLTRNRLAEISISTALATPWNPDPDSNVNTLVADDGRLFVGGNFTFTSSTGGSNIRLRPFMAAFDSTGSTNNVAPIFNTLGNFSLLEDAPATNVTVTGISAGPPGEASQTLILSATSDNPSVIPHPTVTYTSPNTTGALLIAPATNMPASGSSLVTITVTLQDSGGTASGGVDTTVNTFRVTMQSVNDRPTMSALANLTFDENPGFQDISLSGITSGAANENQILTVTTFSSDTSAIPNPSITSYTSPQSTGTLRFTPHVNGNGVITISVVVSDDGGTAFGGVNALTNTFTVTLNPVNDAPVFSVANRTYAENSGTVTAPISSVQPGGFSFNPWESNQVVTFTATSGNPALIANPIVANYTNGTSGSLLLTVVSNATGTATITVIATDNGGTANGGRNSATNTFTVTVQAVNDPPTLAAIPSVTFNEDVGPRTNLLSGISPGPANESGQIVTITAFSSDTNAVPHPAVAYTAGQSTGSLVYTPLTNVFGTVTLTVIARDNGGTTNGAIEIDAVTNTFTVTLNAVNDRPLLAPVASLTVAEDSGLQTIALSGLAPGPTNENAQTLTLTATSGSPALVPNPSVIFTNGNSTGALNFTPVANAFGTATITLVVADSGGTTNGGVNALTNTFTITVSPVNDPPAFSPVASVTLNEDSAPQTVNFTGLAAGPTNENSQTFSVTAIRSSDTNLVVVTATNYVASATTGSLTFRPVTNGFGTATVSIVLTDNGGTSGGGVDASTNTFTIVVNPVNDPPTLAAFTNLTVSQDAPQQAVTLSGLTAGPVNESLQALTITAASSHTAIIPIPSVNLGSGVVNFTPAPGASGLVTLSVTVTDDGGTAGGGVNSVTNTFTVTVEAAPNYSLVITRAGSGVTVSWPTNATGFVLQSSETFSLWSNVPGTPSVVSNQNVVTNSVPAATNLFYRLRKP